VSSDAASAESWTLGRMLEWTRQHLKKSGSETARLDAEVLLAHACGCPRIQLYVRFDELATDQQRRVMRDLVKRRAAAEPVAYLVGHREFYGLDFIVNRHVLIPRPDTETLVLDLITRARRVADPRILDLCTGSGCIAVAAAAGLPTATITAVDISPESLDVARQNVNRHVDSNKQPIAPRVTLLQSDLFEAVPKEEFDFIVSNPPYVAEAEVATLAPDVRNHEPLLALRGGSDGLDVIRRIVVEAISRLKPRGELLIEFSPEQASAVQKLVTETGAYEAPTVLQDVERRSRAIRAIRLSDKPA
jgi:release factor glutamine methyltransferase